MTELITRRAAAEQLGRHPHTLARWANQGYGPVPVVLNGKWMYQVSDIARFTDESQSQVRTIMKKLAAQRRAATDD
jgi:predicted site-specific integrase-resolvase